MSDPTETAQTVVDGREVATGRFGAGNRISAGADHSDRVDLVKLARAKCKELGLNLEAMLWDVLFAMLLKGACGDTKAASLVLDRFAGVIERGPLVALNFAERVPQAPPLVSDGRGAPTLNEHLERLVMIANERGLTELEGLKPAQVIDTIAERHAIDALLS